MNLERFVSIDFETANANYASACQVALVLMENGEVKDTWQSFVRPEDKFSELGSIQKRIHGISRETYLQAPTLLELWPTMQSFIGTNWLVAHNASFDIGVLRQSLASWEMSPTIPKSVCSVRMAKEAYGSGFSKLEALAKKYDIPLANHHNAVDDARACGLITNRLFEALRINDFDELHRRFGYEVAGLSATFGNNLKLDKSRLEVEERQKEIQAFFSKGPAHIYVDEAPLCGLSVGSIRSIFGMSNEKLADWVSLLGGSYLDLQPGDTWPDLVIVGNGPSADPTRKANDVRLLMSAKKARVDQLPEDILFELVMKHLVP